MASYMSSKIYRFGVGKSTRKIGKNMLYLYTLAENYGFGQKFATHSQ